MTLKIFFLTEDSLLSYLKNLTCPTSVRGGETSELKFLKIFWVKKNEGLSRSGDQSDSLRCCLHFVWIKLFLKMKEEF